MSPHIVSIRSGVRGIKLKTIKNASITLKLFGIQFIGMAICLAIAFVLVWTGFQSFYTNHKLQLFEQAFTDEYGTSFANESLSIEEIFHRIESFEAAQDAFATVLEIGTIDSNNYNYEIFHNPQRPATQDELNFISRVIDDKQIRKLFAAQQNQKITSLFSEDKEGDSIILIAAQLGGDTNRVLLVTALDNPIVETTGVIRQYIGIVFGLALLLSLFIAYLFSRTVARPLKKIEGVATKIAALDFSQKIDYPYHDEVGKLAESVNQLANQLDVALTNLKQDLQNKNEFLGAVSHEMKTPIALIGGHAEMLQELPLTAMQRNQYLLIISEESEKLGKVLDDLLQLTRMSSGQVQLEKQTFPLNTVIHEVIRRLSPIWTEKNLEVAHSPVDQSIQIHADEMRINQLLTNLLTNAIRHTSVNGKVEISTKMVNSHVRIDVMNEGERIPTIELKRIWEPFVRVEKSRSRDTGGTGIGLSIVKNIVSLHGGSCWAENVKGGVRFSIILPK